MSAPEWFVSAIESKPEHHFVEVEGARVHYSLWGDSLKPGLFFVHGYSANSNWWDFIAPHFLNDFCVVAIDLSGNGDSDHREIYSQELYAKELQAVCVELKWSSAIFIAHSMGGSISLKATSFFPEIFNKLILLDSIVVVPPDKARPMGKSMIRANVFYETLENAVESFRLIPPQPCRNDYILEHIANNSFKETSDGWLLKSDGKMMVRRKRKTKGTQKEGESKAEVRQK